MGCWLRATPHITTRYPSYKSKAYYFACLSFVCNALRPGLHFFAYLRIVGIGAQDVA